MSVRDTPSNLFRDLIVSSLPVFILLLCLNTIFVYLDYRLVFDQSTNTSSSGVHVYIPSDIQIVTSRTSISPLTLINPQLVPSYTPILSLQYNPVTSSIHDYSSQNYTVVPSSSSSSNSTTICRDKNRGAIICSSVSVSHASISTEWSILFWMTAPLSINASFPIFGSWLTYPWTFNSLVPISNASIATSSIYYNNWAHIAFIYTSSPPHCLTVYWNGVVIYYSCDSSLADISPPPILLSVNASVSSHQLDQVSVIGQAVDALYVQYIYETTLGIQTYQVLLATMQSDGWPIDQSQVHFGTLNASSNSVALANTYVTLVTTNTSYQCGLQVLHATTTNWTTVIPDPDFGYSYTVLTVRNQDKYGVYHNYGGLAWDISLPNCTSYTLTLWLKLPLVGANEVNTLMMSIFDALGNPYSVHFQVWGCGLAFYGPFGKALEPGKWTHVAITYTNGQNQFYFDGTLVYSALSYNSPEPEPYLLGILNALPANGVQFGTIGLYCACLTQPQVVMEMTQTRDVDIKRQAYPVPTGIYTPPLAYSYPSYVNSTEYLGQILCLFPTPEEVAAVQHTLPDDVYTHFYIDQVNGNDNNNGLTPQTAWATPLNINTYTQFQPNVCIDIELCYGDRFYNLPTLFLPTGTSSTNPNCPMVFKSHACDSVRPAVYPLLSGLSLLPQITNVIEWKQVNYINSLGVPVDNVLMYNLSKLWSLQGSTSGPYIPINPIGVSIFAYQPIVLGTMYNTPTIPNIDHPLYPYGRFYNQTLTLYSASGTTGGDGGPQGTSTCTSLILPGAWCYHVFYKAFKGNQTAYDHYFYYTNQGQTFWAGSSSIGLMENYNFWGNNPAYGQNIIYLPGLNMTRSHYFNCSQWFENDIQRPNDPFALKLDWDNEIILTVGILDEHIGQFGYDLPGAWMPYAGFSENSYFSTQNGVLNTTTNPCWDGHSNDGSYYDVFAINQGAPLGSPSPISVFQGGTACGGWAYQLQCNKDAFDSPGEYIMDPVNGLLYLVPWNSLHTQYLLTTSNLYTLDHPIDIFQDIDHTVGWARTMNYNTQYGISVNNPTSDIIIQELELSGYGYMGENPGGYQYEGWAMLLRYTHNVLVLNVTISQSKSGVQLFPNQGYTGFIINTTVINTTLAAPFRLLNGDTGGYGSNGICFSCVGGCSLINTTCFFSDMVNHWNYARNAQFINNVGNQVWEHVSPLWMMEHSLVNQSDFFWSDTGPEISTRTANPFVILYDTFDGTPQRWGNNLHTSQCYVYGSLKGDGVETFYWLDFGSALMHGNKFLNVYGGVVSNHRGVIAFKNLCCNNWASDTFFDFSSNLMTQGTEQWIVQPGDENNYFDFGELCGPHGTLSGQFIPGQGTTSLGRPTTPTAALGRPFGIFNNTAIWDDFTVNANVMPWDYPLYPPSPQGQSAFWMWYEEESYTAYVLGYQLAYATLQHTNISATDYDMSQLAIEAGFPAYFLPTHATNMINTANADITSVFASNNNNPTPILGKAATLALKAAKTKELDDEAAFHLQVTEPAIWAMFMSRMPYYIPPASTPYITSQMWPDNVFGFYASQPYEFPNEPYSIFQLNTCSSYDTCQSSIIFDLRPNPLTGAIEDRIFNQTSMYGCTDAPTSHHGISWDPFFGAVIDSTINPSPSNGYYMTCYLDYKPIYTSFTAEFWILYPTYTYTYTTSAGSYAFTNCGSNSGLLAFMQIWWSNGCNPVPFYSTTPNYLTACQTYFTSNVNASCGPNYNPYIPIGQQSGTTGCHSCGIFGTNYPWDNIIGKWTHFAYSSDHVQQQMTFYINGVAQWTVPGIYSSSIGGGGTGANMMYSYLKVKGITFYGGVLSDAAILSIYQRTSMNNASAMTMDSAYNGPLTLPIFTGANTIFSLSYNATTGLFWNGNTVAPAGIFGLGVINATSNIGNYVDISAMDPSTTTTNKVISNDAYFSFGLMTMTNWILTFQAFFATQPSNTNNIWFFIPSDASSSPSTVTGTYKYQLGVLLVQTNPSTNAYTICLVTNVYQPPWGSSISVPQYDQTSCVDASFTLQVSTWMSFSLAFNSLNGQFTLSVNGVQVGDPITGWTGSLQSSHAVIFYPPEFLWTASAWGYGGITMCIASAQITRASSGFPVPPSTFPTCFTQCTYVSAYLQHIQVQKLN